MVGITRRLLMAVLVSVGILATTGSPASPIVIDTTTDCSEYGDSALGTPMTRGRYHAIAEFFECLAARCSQLTSEFACEDLAEFFASLHPVARIDSASDVQQLIEVAFNTLTLIDSSALYLTVGDADTYGAWYLQRVKRLRTDVRVVSLPFLMAEEYRRELFSDPLFRRVAGFDQLAAIPVPPTTADTDSARILIVRAWRQAGQLTPIYFSPTCTIDADTGLHVIDLGLVQQLSESAEDSASFRRLLTTMREGWLWKEGSKGLPPEERAIRNTTIHYLSLAMSKARQFMSGAEDASFSELLELLDPVCRTDWRFNVLRYTSCKACVDSCALYLSRLRDYSKEHPDEEFLKRFLEDTEHQ